MICDDSECVPNSYVDFTCGSLCATCSPLPWLTVPPLSVAVVYRAGQLYSIVSSMSKEHVLSAGFDINTPDNFGRTCLHAAASGGCVSYQTRPADGQRTGLLCANTVVSLVSSRNVECLNLLLSSGTDLNKRDKMGR